jgi:L-lysine exporter family protein LysE/ArgO
MTRQFIVLGLGARLLAPWLARPAAWRLLDLATGLTMCALAARLAVSGAIW